MKKCTKNWPKLDILNFEGEFWIASKNTNKKSKWNSEARNVDPRISQIDKIFSYFCSKFLDLHSSIYGSSYFCPDRAPDFGERGPA